MGGRKFLNFPHCGVKNVPDLCWQWGHRFLWPFPSCLFYLWLWCVSRGRDYKLRVFRFWSFDCQIRMVEEDIEKWANYHPYSVNGKIILTYSDPNINSSNFKINLNLAKITFTKLSRKKIGSLFNVQCFICYIN